MPHPLDFQRVPACSAAPCRSVYLVVGVETVIPMTRMVLGLAVVSVADKIGIGRDGQCAIIADGNGAQRWTGRNGDDNCGRFGRVCFTSARSLVKVGLLQSAIFLVA